MLNSLLEADYVQKDSATGKYVIGYKAFELGQLYLVRFPFLQAAQAHAFSLMEKWGMSIYVSTYVEGVNTLIISDTHPVNKRILHEGLRCPAYAIAQGKVLMAELTDEELHSDLNKIELQPFTPNTYVDRGQLEQELQKVRQQGYAYNNEEYMTGISCVAAPIRDLTGKTVAAISISGETDKVQKNRNSLIREIMFTAFTLSGTQ